MTISVRATAYAVICLAVAGCMRGGGFISLPFETRIAFVNLSREFYATIGLRDSAQPELMMSRSPLLAPGATFRADFLDLTESGCPDSVDLQLLLYRRVSSDPIGLDVGEAVEQTPVVAAEVAGVPACSVEPLIAFTIVNWDAPEGSARVKIAQGSSVLESTISAAGIFQVNDDGAWVIEGVDASLAAVAPPPALAAAAIEGRVTLADGTGVAGIGVLIRSFFRVRLDDEDDANDPDSGFSDPIAFTSTDGDGAFSLERPPGAYQVEFFSDDFRFRPATIVVESPIQVIQVIAEPLS